MAFDWSVLANPLKDVGYGLTQGNNLQSSLKAAGQRTSEMEAPRAQAELMAQEQQQRLAKVAQEKEQVNQTAKMLADKGHPDLSALAASGYGNEALREYFNRSKAPDAAKPMEINGQLIDPATGKVLGDYRTPDEAGTEFGLQPQWGLGPDGQPVLGQMSKDGRFVPTQLPEGVTAMDPRHLYSERSYGTKVGGSLGEQAAGAPSDLTSGATALGLVESIRNDPELGWATGTSAGLGGNLIPGTGRYGFQKKVEQAKSGAFLTAIQEMRGMGALSNAEGQTATAAVTRMDTALSKEDFIKALDDYEAIIARGMENAQRAIDRSGGMVPQPAMSAPGRFRYNPVTGELE